MDERTYGDRIADIYDSLYTPEQVNAEAPAAFLAKLAGGGRALELGIGTGRVAIPLSAKGVEVHGIEGSPAMVAQLHAKPGSEAIQVTLGDMAEVGVDGTFSVVYAVFNTFFALESQDRQIECLRNVADHLTDDGTLVLDAFVPDPALWDGNPGLQVTRVEEERAAFSLFRHDPVEQTVFTQIVVLDSGGMRMCPMRTRYAWPQELDLMARLAGLALRERKGGWRGQRFTAASRFHVSVYEKG